MSRTSRSLVRQGEIASGYARRSPPQNKLLRALYEIERVTLGPTVGVIEEYFVDVDPDIAKKPIWEAMRDGWKQAKTFDNIVENPWLAFIPIGNVVLMTQIGKVHRATIFLVFVPIIGWIIPFYWWWKIAEARNKPGWYSLLMIIPIVNFVVIGILAWMD